MAKTIVNNNIKLKSGGGVINDATDGLSVDTTIYPTTPTIMQASDTTVLTANTARYGNNTNETIIKNFKLRDDLYGTVRVKFQKQRTGSYSATVYWLVRVNDVLVYTTSEGGGTGVSEYTDVSVNVNVPKNSYISISAYTEDNREAYYLRNASISYDLVAQPSTAAAVVTN